MCDAIKNTIMQEVHSVTNRGSPEGYNIGIDGTYLPIIPPRQHHEDYVNRKGYHSIIMQAVVDPYLLIIDVLHRTARACA